MKCFYLFCTMLLTNSAYSMDEVVSVDSILTHLQAAIEKEDAQEVSRWHHSLKLLVKADSNFLNGDQMTQYRQLHSKLISQMNPILSQQNQGLDVDKDMEEMRKVASWLIKKLEQDHYYIEWTNLLGKGTETVPSPETLKKHRIQSLRETGSIKTMN